MKEGTGEEGGGGLRVQARSSGRMRSSRGDFRAMRRKEDRQLIECLHHIYYERRRGEGMQEEEGRGERLKYSYLTVMRTTSRCEEKGAPLNWMPAKR